MPSGSKGYSLLAEVNIVRGVLGTASVGQLVHAQVTRMDGIDALADVLGCDAGPGITERWSQQLTLRLPDESTTEAVAEALRQPFDAEACEVLATDAMISFDLAAFYKVAMWSEDVLRGWFEPTDDDPSVWDLHLMPGELYPPGHAPKGYEEMPLSRWPE
jgi:hypothetical protein